MGTIDNSNVNLLDNINEENMNDILRMIEFEKKNKHATTHLHRAICLCDVLYLVEDKDRNCSNCRHIKQGWLFKKEFKCSLVLGSCLNNITTFGKCEMWEERFENYSRR